MPKRIQRKREKGWRMPLGVVYVGRGTKWGNPYLVGRNGTREDCVRFFRIMAERWVASAPDHYADLRGKDLACWCPLDQPCHADVLLELANQPQPAASGGGE